MTNETTASQTKDFRKVLVAVRESLQFANDSPNGGINDTIWMMHGSAPETVFDFIDAALESKIPGYEETPDLFASQPKSIGDDAQFFPWLDRLNDCNSREEFEAVSRAFVIYLDSRAPAAQASATIQAAPDADELHFNAQRLRNVAALVGVPAEGDDAQVDSVRGALLGMIAAKLRRTATIMVAEPVAWRIGMIVHHDKAKAELDSIHWNVPLEPLYLAAPIVSQPVESKPLYLVKFDGTEAWKEASEDAYWTFSERNRKIVYELAAPIVAEPVSHELMQQLGTMRAVGAAPMVADPAGVAGLLPLQEKYDGLQLALRATCTALKHTQDKLAEVLSAATIKAVPSEALDKAVRALELYAESYDLMSRIGDGKVDCNSVKHDISRNMIDAVKRAFAAPLADETTNTGEKA